MIIVNIRVCVCVFVFLSLSLSLSVLLVHCFLSKKRKGKEKKRSKTQKLEQSKQTGKPGAIGLCFIDYYLLHPTAIIIELSMHVNRTILDLSR
jgi:hypothetical protein